MYPMEKDIKTTSGSTGREGIRRADWHSGELDIGKASACADLGLRRLAIVADLSCGVIGIGTVSAMQGSGVNPFVKSRAKFLPDHARAELSWGKVA